MEDNLVRDTSSRLYMCLMTEVHLQFKCGLPVFVIEVSRDHVSSKPLLCFAGEPFINGEAVPYDPKYHEQWLRNNAREHCYVRLRSSRNVARREIMQNF